MSKFNTAAKIPMTVNHEGWKAYAMKTREKLVTQVLTSFFNESKFYGDNSDEIHETIKTAIHEDPEFVAKLTVFARREFNMRSVSHVLLGYLAHEENGKPFVREVLKHIVLRGDDVTEILSFYLNTFGKPIPNSLRKGLRDVFVTFDKYTLAKYKGTGNTVKMRDILCLTHPTPKNEEQSETWKKLLEGRLEPAYTWETELSVKGNNKETWEALIDSGRLPYMAALRNLSNMIIQNPDNLDKVLDYISDPDAVRKSKQLPFRYLSAYNRITYLDGTNAQGDDLEPEKIKALETLENAVDISVNNLPKIPGHTVIAIDMSGSMTYSVSRNSDINCCDIAAMLGIIANRICETATVYAFDTQIQHLHIPKRNGILSSVNSICHMGGGTCMDLPFRKMISDHVKCDRLIILSDTECNYAETWGYTEHTVQHMADEYRKKSGNNIWVHAIDLCGYGTQQFTGPRTNIIAGWSEKVFEFILMAEKGEGALIKRIQDYSV